MTILFTILNPYTGMYFAEGQGWVSSQLDGVIFDRMSQAQAMIDRYHLDAVVELTAVIE